MATSRLHAVFRGTPRRVEILRVLVVGLRCTIWRMFSYPSTFRWRARSDETWALGSVPHSHNVLNTLENILRSGILRIRNGILRQQQWHYHRRSRKRIAYLHIRHLWRCALFFTRLLQCHNSQLTLHTDSLASDWGTVWREKKILGIQDKQLYSQITLSRKSLWIGRMHINDFFA